MSVVITHILCISYLAIPILDFTVNVLFEATVCGLTLRMRLDNL
jgi:hypothetical protein